MGQAFFFDKKKTEQTHDRKITLCPHQGGTLSKEIILKSDRSDHIIHGIHALNEALKSSRTCRQILVEEGKSNKRIESLLNEAHDRNIAVEFLPKPAFSQRFGSQHQGIAGIFSAKAVMDLAQLIDHALAQSTTPTLVLLDGIQDPQNLGAIIRSAETLGIHGLIVPQNRSARVNSTVAKCAAGALELLPVTTVSNLGNALRALKKAGFWCVGLDMAGESSCFDYRFDAPTALVAGGEHKGLRPIIKKDCDTLIRIPMQGQTQSLNVSASCAIVFYEILRQNKKAE